MRIHTCVRTDKNNTHSIKSKQLKVAQPCWRQCGHMGVGHAHIFWSCPKIEEYWKDVHSIMGKRMSFELPLNCTLLLLGDIPEEILTPDKYLIKIFLAASKKAITRRWLQQDPPTKEDWIAIIKEIYTMERLTFILRLQEDKSDTYWEKWILFQQPMDIA